MCVCTHAYVCACMKHLELSFLRCLIHFAIPSKKNLHCLIAMLNFNHQLDWLKST